MREGGSVLQPSGGQHRQADGEEERVRWDAGQPGLWDGRHLPHPRDPLPARGTQGAALLCGPGAETTGALRHLHLRGCGAGSAAHPPPQNTAPIPAIPRVQDE